MAISYPTFDEYPNALSGSVIIPVTSPITRANQRMDDLESLAADFDAVILVNPDNPSGSYINRERVLQFIERMNGEQRLVVLDESFARLFTRGR